MKAETHQDEPQAIRGHLRVLFTSQGAALYGGEQITQLEHALQSAMLAEEAGESPVMILAAMLHDVGHFFEADFDRALETEVDGRHEHIGAKYLSRWFGPEVTEPIRLHVAAKRFLCATRPMYLASLSEASIHSLELQGGPMSEAEVQAFRGLPFAAQAVRLREYDDQAKLVGLTTPGLEYFLGQLGWR
jgi:phosphonate degradation associated HDIG domain protein